jgi:hypothetical protein
MSQRGGGESVVVATGCASFLSIFVINALFGAWSVSYLLSFAGREISTTGAVIIGMLVGEITIPIAVIVKLLSIFTL